MNHTHSEKVTSSLESPSQLELSGGKAGRLAWTLPLALTLASLPAWAEEEGGSPTWDRVWEEKGGLAQGSWEETPHMQAQRAPKPGKLPFLTLLGGDLLTIHGARRWD